MGILRGTAKTIEVNAHAKITEDLGKLHNIKFKVTFKRRTVDEAQAIIRDMNDKDSDTSPQTILRDDIVSWRDMSGEGGEVPFDEDNLEAALQHFEYLNALFDAWGSAQMGRVVANAKN